MASLYFSLPLAWIKKLTAHYSEITHLTSVTIWAIFCTRLIFYINTSAFIAHDAYIFSKILCVSLKSRVIRYMFRNSNIKNKKNYLGFETDFITSTSIFICNQYGCFESCQFRPCSVFFLSWRLMMLTAANKERKQIWF